MMFTCELASDILFYSFSEWIYYGTDPHITNMGTLQEWAVVCPLFHQSFIPWRFYLVLAVVFGFIIHVHKSEHQKYSEACRPILGKYTDGILGTIISMIDSIPLAPVILVVVLITMMLFYTTSFDFFALTASCYSYQ